MERVIQALFSSEEQAFKGLLAVQELDRLQDISLGEYYVLSKDLSGTVAIRTAKDEAEGYSAIGGGIVGGLLGLLAGPLGFLVGIGAGMVAGAAGDTVRAEGVSDYLDAVSANIPAGKSLLVAHVWEDWEKAVDVVLEPFGADVYRLNINDEIFVPVQTELQQINTQITAAETAYLGAGEADKAVFNENLLRLKIKREEILRKIDHKSVKQEAQYATWIDRHEQNERQLLLDNVAYSEEKKNQLAGRLAEHKARLMSLRESR